MTKKAAFYPILRPLTKSLCAQLAYHCHSSFTSGTYLQSHHIVCEKKYSHSVDGNSVFL